MVEDLKKKKRRIEGATVSTKLQVWKERRTFCMLRRLVRTAQVIPVLMFFIFLRPLISNLFSISLYFSRIEKMC